MQRKSVMNGKEVRMVMSKNSSRVVLFVNGRMLRSYSSMGTAMAAAEKIAS